MFSNVLQFIFLLIPIVSCQSIQKENRTPSSEEKSTWVALFKEAQQNLDQLNFKKSCGLFKDLKNKRPPLDQLEEILKLRQLQACKKNDFHLSQINENWLEKDAIFFGLRNTNNPNNFVKYYEAFLKLDRAARNEIEFLERSALFQKMLKRTNGKGEAFEQLLEFFPSYYVDYKRSIPEDKKFDAAFGLRMQRRFNDARKVYAEIISREKSKLNTNKTANSERLRKIEKAYEFLRVTYRIEERKEKGISEVKKGYDSLRKFISKNNTKEFHGPLVEIGVQLARDIWTEGRKEEARKLLLNLEKFSKSKTDLSQVNWVLGRMIQEDGDYQGSIDFFKKALDEATDNDFKIKLYWLIAWNLKKMDKKEESIAALDEMSDFSEKVGDEVSKYKALFWKAKILTAKNEKENAQNIFRKISREHTFGYYGRLSLLEVNPEYWKKIKSSSEISLSDKDERVQLIELLSDLNQREIASQFIKNIWQKEKSSWRKKFDNKVFMLSLNDRAGLLKDNQQYIEIFDYEEREELFENHPRLMFPEPHKNIVDSNARQNQVPRELIYAIMRQESLFDEKARSPADAFGLLQLIPRIANKYSKKTGVAYARPSDMFKPEVIIPLGSAHLATLMNKFENSKMLTAAAYNAGFLPVRRWQKSKFSEDPLEFIEDIPYAETEKYVKLVFRNLSFYLMYNESLKYEEKIDLLRGYFKLPSQPALTASSIEKDVY